MLPDLVSYIGCVYLAFYRHGYAAEIHRIRDLNEQQASNDESDTDDDSEWDGHFDPEDDPGLEEAL